MVVPPVFRRHRPRRRGAPLAAAAAVARRLRGDRDNTSGDWLLWGDPRVRLTSRGTPVAIDLRHSDDGVRRPGTVPWSEVNVFKAYALFNAEEVARRRPDAIAKAIPWARSLRLFSSLGGNWGPTLEREYDRQLGRN